MDEKLLKMVETLASKLGVTAEHLWGVLTKQAAVTGMIDLTLALALIALTGTAFTYVRHEEWDSDVEVLPWSAVTVLFFVTLFYVMANAEEIVTAFVNPEYWALYQLIH